VTCPHCRDAGEVFGDRSARRELRRYRKRGPSKTSRILLDAIRERLPADGFTVLDIGGGVGVLQHELLDDGADRVVSVDASPAYLGVARGEAERRSRHHKLEQRLGDFVDLCTDVEDADIVTLDRVLCCYPDMHALAGRSAERARALYGVVFPREEWWVRVGVALLNLWQRLRGSDFRVYVHPIPAVLAVVEGRGLEKVFDRTTFSWKVMLFARRDLRGGAAGAPREGRS
jgi:magnesium-protoporphyrin O-methyltransferase